MVSVACETGNASRYGLDAILSDRSNPEGTSGTGAGGTTAGEQRLPLARVVDPQATSRRSSEGGGPSYRLALPPAHDRFEDLAEEDMVTIGPYTFSAAALQQGDAFLRSLPRRPHVQLVVVDEVGPLELHRGGGVLGALRELFSSCLPLLVVVRPSLVVAACRLAENLRSGCVPETLGVADLENPGDARVLKTLL